MRKKAINEMINLRWINHDEFSLNDELYDVLKKESGSDGEIRLYCIKDLKEKELNENLGKHISRHMDNEGSENKNEKKSAKNLVKDYFPTVFLLSVPGICSDVEYFFPQISLQLVDPENLSPPPKIS
jgi:hypothetical protein